MTNRATMNGILFEIKATWANQGRLGETRSVVRAEDAIAALQLFWKPENPVDLRDVTIRWLTPSDCVVDGLPRFCQACEEELTT